MELPRKLWAPMDTWDSRKDVLEKSALMTDSPSATIVPRPTETWNGVSWRTSVPKLDPVCSTVDRSYPRARR